MGYNIIRKNRSARSRNSDPAYSASLKSASNLLSREDEHQLAAAYRNFASNPDGNSDNDDFESGFELSDRISVGIAARNALIQSQFLWIHKLASRFATERCTADDLAQVGIEKLIEKLNQFDPSRGTRLVSFVTPLVVRSFIKYWGQNEHLISLPPEAIRLGGAILRGEVSDEEIEARPMKSATAMKAANVLAGMLSIDFKPRGDVHGEHDFDNSIQSILASDDADGAAAVEGAMDHERRLQLLRNAIAVLPGQWQRVLEMRYGDDPKKVRDIAGELGVTRQRIQQIEARAIEVLRDVVSQMSAGTFDLATFDPRESGIGRSRKAKLAAADINSGGGRERGRLHAEATNADDSIAGEINHDGQRIDDQPECDFGEWEPESSIPARSLAG